MRKLFERLRDEAGDGLDGGGGNAPPSSEGSIFSDGDASSAPPVTDPPPATPPAGDPPSGDAAPVIEDTRTPDPAKADMMAKPYYDGLYDSTGKLDKSRLDNLPDNLKKYSELFKRYDTLDGIMGALGNFSSLAGRKGDLTAYERPADDASEKAKTDHASFLKVANGVPDDIKGYGIEKPEGVSDEQWDASQMDGYLDSFHKHNASPELVKEIFDMNVKIGQDAEKAASDTWTAFQKGEVATLTQEHKSNLPEVRALAERAASRFGADVASATSSAASTNAWHKVAMALGEDKLPSGGGDPLGGITDRQKALSILNDPTDPMHKAFHDPNHHQHKEAVDLRSQYNRNWANSRK